MWDFIPDEEQDKGKLVVPYFEDARSDYAPYYSTDKTETEARRQVVNELSKLGAYDVNFQAGHFDVDNRKRYGYVIHFRYNNAPGLLRVAGLPMRSATSAKLAKLRAQALLNVRDQLKAAITNRIFSPGADPLVPMMLVDTTRGITLGDLMTNYLETGRLPQLSAGEEEVDIVEGDFTEG